MTAVEATAGVTELARAKVNLHLHVLGRRADGLHLLDSLVVFPDLGDLLEVEPADRLSLSVAGPFADQLGAGDDNLVLRAAEALAARAFAGRGPGAAIRLTKSLPVASGIGGGSADAAATLRALARLWGVQMQQSDWARLALGLGADVPVCLGSPRPMRMGGIGDDLRPAPGLPPFWLVLANPGTPVPTAEVFRRLCRRDGAPAEPPTGGFADAAALADWLRCTCNMLEAPAEAVSPSVATLRGALAGASGCLLARMSGSGATCYGLFADAAPALAAAEMLRLQGWWAAAAPVGG